jgi:ribosome-binding factor A
MRHRRHSQDRARALFAELGDDHGEGAQVRARRGTHRRLDRRLTSQVRSIDRKASQLCRQVAVTLDEVFPDCGDPALQGLRVASVVPFPDTSRLLVSVTRADGRAGEVNVPAPVLEHLQRAGGYLRCEVAAAITRKRAPSLFFRVAEPAPVESGS